MLRTVQLSSWLFQDGLAEVPLYVHAREVCLPDGMLEAVELT